MASFLKHGDKIKIKVPRTEEKDKFTIYEIQVELDDVKWTVLHRFKDFVQMHELLTTGHSVAKDLLPPKKVLGNKEPSFIEKRRNGLEVYLSTIVRFLQKTMPKELIEFLDFQYYDISFLLHYLAEEFFTLSETCVMQKIHHFTPLELHAISERLRQSCPAFGQMNQRQDFSHVLDYCSQVQELRVQGNFNFYRKSNIIPNKLPYEFSSFKSLQTLVLKNINVEMITDLGELRSTLKSLHISYSKLLHLKDFLMCDQIHKEQIDANGPYAYKNITNADFSSNQLVNIDESIQLLPNIESLNLECNKIEDIQFLNSLIKLKYLNLSANHFKNTENLELKLCKITYLDLSQNQLTSLKPFSKLYSLETLDISSNKISDISEVKHISNLPCLENLILTGNAVSIIIDYRVKVLELFNNRATEVCLDNEKSQQKELDKVAILQAIRMGKEGKISIIK